MNILHAHLDIYPREESPCQPTRPAVQLATPLQAALSPPAFSGLQLGCELTPQRMYTLDYHLLARCLLLSFASTKHCRDVNSLYGLRYADAAEWAEGFSIFCLKTACTNLNP